MQPRTRGYIRPPDATGNRFRWRGSVHGRPTFIHSALGLLGVKWTGCPRKRMNAWPQIRGGGDAACESLLRVMLATIRGDFVPKWRRIMFAPSGKDRTCPEGVLCS